MKQYQVHVNITDSFTVNVAALSEEVAEQVALDILCDLQEPTQSTYFDFSEGFEVSSCKEMEGES